MAGDALNGFAFDNQTIYTGVEMHLATAGYNLVAHGLDDAWQTVGAYVGVGINQDVGAGTKLAEYAQYFVNIATFL